MAANALTGSKERIAFRRSGQRLLHALVESKLSVLSSSSLHSSDRPASTWSPRARRISSTSATSTTRARRSFSST